MKKFSEIVSNKECLYRYRPYKEEHLDALKKERLYFSNPKDFNDPYDNLLFANSNRIVSYILGNINSNMDSYLEKNVKDVYPYNIAKFMWNKNKDKMLDDHKERVFAAVDAVRVNLKNNSRIICFSEVYDSMLMWSHYAYYHEGFLLVYDKESLKKAKRYNINGEEVDEKTRLMPVRYVSEQTDMTNDVRDYVRVNVFDNMGDIGNGDASIPAHVLRDVITEKAMDWSYEKEWRLIPRVVYIEKESKLGYISCKPLAVIIGSQCQGENREELISICRGINIPVYGIYLSESDADFRLKINDDGNLEMASNKYIFIPPKR